MCLADGLISFATMKLFLVFLMHEDEQSMPGVLCSQQFCPLPAITMSDWSRCPFSLLSSRLFGRSLG